MRIFIISLFLISALTVDAQNSSSSIGLRLGGLSGITYKYIDDNLKGFELMLGGKEKGIVFCGLLEKYKPIATNRIAGMYFYFGVGGHSGYTKYKVEYKEMINDKTYYYENEESSPVLGGDFLLGVEYNFETIPLRISLDYKPYIEIFGKDDFRVDMWDMGFTLSYVINRHR